MGLKKQTTTGAACRDCGKIPATICFYLDRETWLVICPRKNFASCVLPSKDL